ncbi:hypothetical protein [Vibrio sp. 10N.247.311.51]|uniref:hypothetical protein n=1 Tax=Vibrio sp. 10N.247.311.51 TaxID=3229996 RepID=UPI003553CA95
MITFITGRLNGHEPDFLTAVKTNTLCLISMDGQLLATRDAPLSGWTHESLCQTNELAQSEWAFCGVDAYLGDQWVGSSEI